MRTGSAGGALRTRCLPEFLHLPLHPPQLPDGQWFPHITFGGTDGMDGSAFTHSHQMPRKVP